MSAFVLQIQDLDESERLRRFVVQRPWLNGVLADSGLRAGEENGELEIHAQRSGDDVLVRGSVQANLLAECARCLDDVQLALSVALSALYSPEHTRPKLPEDLELAADDLDRAYFSGAEVVLDDLVREQLILEAPMKPLCADTCEGIDIPSHVKPPDDVFEQRPVKGPFAALSQLKDKLRKSEE